MNCMMRRSRKTIQLKESDEEYTVAEKEAWLEFIVDLAEEYFDNEMSTPEDKPTIEEFAEYNEGEKFTFKSYDDWTVEQIAGACDEGDDYFYDQVRDRELEE